MVFSFKKTQSFPKDRKKLQKSKGFVEFSLRLRLLCVLSHEKAHFLRKNAFFLFMGLSL